MNTRMPTWPKNALAVRRVDGHFNTAAPRRRPAAPAGAMPKRSAGMPRATRWLWALWPAAILGFPAGCADNRMSLAELQEMEREIAAVEPVEIDTGQLALIDLQPYTVGPGDVLAITMMGATELVVQVRVHDDGSILLPLVGKLTVSGLTLAQIESAVYDAHVPKFVKDLSVFVQLAGPEATTVVVVGAAAQRGLVTLPTNERNVLYALARSGGFGAAGSGRVRVRPIDPEQPEVTYDLADVNGLRRALVAPPLQTGDMLFVEPAETSAIFTMGLLNAPGPIPVPPDGTLSLVRTVCAAGGLRDFLDPKEATLWRRLPDGRQVRAKLELDDIMAGEVPDIALRPGDVLEIPHTADTRFREWAVANIKIGPFGIGAYYDPIQVSTFRDGSNKKDAGYARTLQDTLRYGLPSLLIPPVPAPR